MPKVKLKTRTRWEGKLRNPGDVLEVKKEIAERWERNGLAEVLKEKKKDEADDKKGGK